MSVETDPLPPVSEIELDPDTGVHAITVNEWDHASTAGCIENISVVDDSITPTVDVRIDSRYDGRSEKDPTRLILWFRPEGTANGVPPQPEDVIELTHGEIVKDPGERKRLAWYAGYQLLLDRHVIAPEQMDGAAARG